MLERGKKDELRSEYPEWQREVILKAREIQRTEHYIELPNNFEIDSYEVMERFCGQYPYRYISARLSDAIKGKGAFRRFKDMISRLGIQAESHRFERQTYEYLPVE